jgi:undecaprenyl-diphosphatase
LDWLTALKALFLGFIEGLTEFLPVSSTGHLIVFEDLLDFSTTSRTTFIVAIQSGAILAVCWEYRERLLRILRGLFTSAAEQRLASNVVIGFLPAAAVGVTAKDLIEARLFNPVSVATALVIGGLVILWAEARHRRLYGERDLLGARTARVETIDDIGWTDALKVGALQCLALVPGTSRSGATIIGALMIGFSRKAAAEFSFFLAIPTVIGASVYSLYKARHQLGTADLPAFALGAIAAFGAALLCVRWLLRYISTRDFTIFAWYRIVFGGFILLTSWAGWVDWAAAAD